MYLCIENKKDNFNKSVGNNKVICCNSFIMQNKKKKNNDNEKYFKSKNANNK